jgi:flavodoxin I
MVGKIEDGYIPNEIGFIGHPSLKLTRVNGWTLKSIKFRRDNMRNIKVIFWSGTGNTEIMANAIAEGAKVNSDVVKVLTVEEATKEDIINSDLIALGCPSMGAENLEDDFMEPFIESLSDIDYSNKVIALFGSYDWGDGEWMRDWQSRMTNYGAKLVDEGLIINQTPDDDGISLCKKLGEKLANS